jgi:hypothetical protein
MLANATPNSAYSVRGDRILSARESEFQSLVDEPPSGFPFPSPSLLIVRFDQELADRRTAHAHGLGPSSLYGLSESAM